jgi:hypothetical protein
MKVLTYTSSFLILLMALTGCQGSNSSNGTPNTPVVINVSCSQLQQGVTLALNGVNTCTKNSDCTQGPPSLSLNNQCGSLTYNGSKDLTLLKTAVSTYNSSCPVKNPPDACPLACTLVQCTNGQCGGGC